MDTDAVPEASPKPGSDPRYSRYSGYSELHAASAHSMLRAGSSVEALVERAAQLGMPALALTDHMTLAGIPRFQAACASHGVQSIIGCELAMADPLFGTPALPAELVVLVQNQQGFARLCQLLSEANLTRPEAPVIPLRRLAEEPDGLLVLTGGRNGSLTRLLLAGRRQEAEDTARRYRDLFGQEQLWIELQHHLLADSRWLMQEQVWIAEATELHYVATNGVHYSTRAQYALYDVLTCTRLKISVDTPHKERPMNDEACLKSGAEMAAVFARLPWKRQALLASSEIAATAHCSLLKNACVAPEVTLPAGRTADEHLRALCEEGLRARYGESGDDAGQLVEKCRENVASPVEKSDRCKIGLPPDSLQRRQLNHELAVIAQLELADFFLCVHDIISAARQRGIRCSGRGSAANSLVAYLLEITGTDPLRHKLLFERFLNPERRGMPDIDVDIQSDRRAEVIQDVERRYAGHAAMVANVVTYRPRLALRDTARALEFPLPLVNQLTKVLPPFGSRDDLLNEQGTPHQKLLDELAAVVRAQAPASAEQDRYLLRLEKALRLAGQLLGLPRHLSLHNGGMVLTREPLAGLLPVRISSNGVRALEVDKDDVEKLGLIKFDLLGLRTLGAVEEAVTLIEEATGKRPDVDHLPLDDAATFRLIRAGQTIAVFQIESPGQWHLLAQTQPRTFDDLIVQTALFRPGPLQANMVHPYVERRQQTQQAEQAQQTAYRQRDAVQTPWHGTPADDFWTAHRILGPILHDSEGILLFQEQILEIAHAFAGLSYAEADGFRRAMSHQRSQQEMEQMRQRFVGGAVARGESQEDAERVFRAISYFVGYGFCKSHAAEFARTIYQTAWLKAHYPAHYLAAFLSSQPAGFFPPHVVLQEAKSLGIPVLRPDLNCSEDRFTVEKVGSPGRECWAIRIGLRQIAQVGENLAQAILWERHRLKTEHGDERSAGNFTSLQEVCERLRPVGLTWQAAEALVLTGACDGLKPSMTRRQRLWHLHDLWPLTALKIRPSGQARRAAVRSAQRAAHRWGKSERGEAGEAGEEEEVTSAGKEGRQAVEQLSLQWEVSVPDEAIASSLHELPALPALTRGERLALEYSLMGMASGSHPLHLLRRELRKRGIQTIAALADLPESALVRVAGWVVSAQRPPTAKGMGFLVLEDVTGHLSVALPPRLTVDLHRTLQRAQVLVVVGRMERIRWYRSLIAVSFEAMTA